MVSPADKTAGTRHRPHRVLLPALVSLASKVWIDGQVGRRFRHYFCPVKLLQVGGRECLIL